MDTYIYICMYIYMCVDALTYTTAPNAESIMWRLAQSNNNTKCQHPSWQLTRMTERGPISQDSSRRLVFRGQPCFHE